MWFQSNKAVCHSFTHSHVEIYQNVKTLMVKYIHITFTHKTLYALNSKLFKFSIQSKTFDEITNTVKPLNSRCLEDIKKYLILGSVHYLEGP